jgi:hypothetical protein
MTTAKKEKNILTDIRDFEQKLRFRGSITTDVGPQDATNIFENLGFTTSINSELRKIQDNSNIRILSPFPHTQEISSRIQPDNMGIASPNRLSADIFNPTLKRFKFITSTLLMVLLSIIIINFILIFAL